MKRIVLITGGQRSGKSSYAEALALQSAPDPVHVATARIFDDEFRERVRRHQERRGPGMDEYRGARAFGPVRFHGADGARRLRDVVVH